MASSFTVFDLAALLSSNSHNTIRWLCDQNLLLDFTSTKCDCGEGFVITKDTAYTDEQCWKCTSRKCRRKFSIRHGSWFSNSNFNVGTVIKLTYFWIREYWNKLAAIETGVSSKSVVDWYNFCRAICVEILEDREKDQEFQPIGGDGIVVEIDESKFGKRKYHRGKHVDRVWVFGAIEGDNKSNCFFFVVPDRSADTLIPLITKYIRRGSTIISDCWKAYDRLGGLGFTHLKVNHSAHFKDPETGAHTNHIESTWHAIKKKKSSYAKHLISSYFAEFIFRRKYLGPCCENPFQEFVKKISCTYTLEKAEAALRTKWTKSTIKRPLALQPNNGETPIKRPPPTPIVTPIPYKQCLRPHLPPSSHQS